MFDLNQISRAGNYLVRYAIGTIESKFPEPPSESADQYYVDIITELRKRELGDLIKQMDSIQKIEFHGVVACRKLEPGEILKDDYSAYLTSRIHFFADDWLGENSQTEEEYYAQIEREADYDINGFYEWEEREFKRFSVTNREELKRLMECVKDYQFKSKLSYEEFLQKRNNQI